MQENAMTIDLGIGQTQEKYFPITSLAEACKNSLVACNSSALQYAPEGGFQELRSELAGFLSRQTHTEIKAKHLLLTNGASHALDLMLKILIQPKTRVAIEDPTYFFALDILKDWDVELIPIRLKNDGIDLDHLEQVLDEAPISLLYTIPFYQNPTGVCISQNKREKLLKLAKERGFRIASDEVYQLVGHEKHPSLFTGTEDQVFSIGSFSKILGPGVRVGWIHATEQNILNLCQCGAQKSAGGISPVMSLVISNMIKTGAQAQALDDLNEIYDRRRTLMSSIFSRNLSPDIAFSPPEGGFFCWLELPEGISASKIQSYMASIGISFMKGAEFSIDSNFHNCIRLSFTYYDDDQITQACTQLCEFLNSYIASAASGNRPENGIPQ